MNPATPLLSSAAPAWVVMWSIAAAIYLFCKGWTCRMALGRGPAPPPSRIAAYLLLWPGMNASAFLSEPRLSAAVHTADWLPPLAKALAGAALLWGGARLVESPLLAGWIGMIGLILLLHFGLFGLIACGWQRLGFRAPPLMRQPLYAHSPSDFWGRRWNTAFHDLVATCLLPPLRRRFGSAAATLLIFVASGLVHDLVISVPAHGGYGLPTLYFTLQGGAVLLERSPRGRRLHLGSGWRGRALLWAAAGVPLGALFHPPFVHRVILPFFHVIHAL